MIKYWNKPCGAEGLSSYRATGRFGFIMIGARIESEAMREALRSTNSISLLEKWNSDKGIYEVINCN